MRTYIQACVLTLLTFFSFNLLFAQNQIRGIGKFKVGESSITITDEVASELGNTIVKVSTNHELYGRREVFVAELSTNLDNQDDRPEIASHCTETRVFYISKYNVSGIELNELLLTFKDNLLVSLAVKNTDLLIDAIKLKYGPGVESTTYEASTCPSVIDGTVLKTKFYNTSWRGDRTIAKQYLGYGPTKNCKIRATGGFVITLIAEVDALNNCEKEGRTRVEEIKLKANKSKLKDF